MLIHKIPAFFFRHRSTRGMIPESLFEIFTARTLRVSCPFNPFVPWFDISLTGCGVGLPVIPSRDTQSPRAETVLL